MKMLPSGAISTSFGSVSRAGGSPGSPPVPIVIRSLPWGLNFSTVWPLPFHSGNFASSPAVADRASATQMLPWRSTSMPCGHKICPAPKLATTLPLGSSLTIGSTFEPAHALAPQRSPAQMCLPSTSTCTALTAPHLRLSGSVPQLRMVSYGFGRLLIGVTLACSGGPDDPRGGPAGCWGCADVHARPAVTTIRARVSRSLRMRESYLRSLLLSDAAASSRIAPHFMRLGLALAVLVLCASPLSAQQPPPDRKSTRLNSSHLV